MAPPHTIESALALIDRRGPDDCWPWTQRPNSDGYGHVSILGIGRSIKAHRFVYSQLVGPIPEGMTVDHTCHNADADCHSAEGCPHRLCCNPAHLEAVPIKENIRRARARQTECHRGHDLTDPANLKPNSRGARQCRACSNISRRDRYLRLGR